MIPPHTYNIPFPSLPSHAQHISIHPNQVSFSPTAICPQTHLIKRVLCVREKGLIERKEERRGNPKKKRKLEKKVKGGAWCGRKDQSISSILGHLQATSYTPSFSHKHTAHTNTHSCPFHSISLSLSLSSLSARLLPFIPLSPPSSKQELLSLLFSSFSSSISIPNKIKSKYLFSQLRINIYFL